MSAIACPSGLQDNWCPTTTAEVLPTVLGLLPPGPAWEAASVTGTIQNQYWSGFANLLGYTYSRLCAFVDEFFCATVNESLDQWVAEFGLNDECDPYGRNLCVKVASQGGTTCDYFVSMSRLSGWVISCHDTSKDPEPIAGCFEVGCTGLGPTPVFNPFGSALGYGRDSLCDYGQVTSHPDPAKWENGHTAGAICAVPGSNMGFGPDTNESCCLIVGYYDLDPVVVPFVSDFCQAADTIYFECPANNPYDLTLLRPQAPTIGAPDATGNYTDWGQAYCWEVTVDLPASWALQASNAAAALAAENAKLTEIGADIPPIYTSSEAGDFMVGDIPPNVLNPLHGGTPLCISEDRAGPTFVLCFLNLIKPAHTTLNVKVIQP